MYFKVVDDNGNIIKCDVIGVFNDKNRNFIVYTNDNEEVYASLYELDKDNNMTLLEIEKEEDWDLVDKFLEEL